MTTAMNSIEIFRESVLGNALKIGQQEVPSPAYMSMYTNFDLMFTRINAKTRNSTSPQLQQKAQRLDLTTAPSKLIVPSICARYKF
jgi:hypothetical protein